MGWLAFLGRVLAPLLEAVWPLILDAITTRREVVTERPSVVVRPDRSEVRAAPSDRLADARRRYGSPVVLVGLLALTGCATREVERVEMVPVIVDAGAAVPNGVKVASADPVPVIVFGPDGTAAEGTTPAPLNLSGSVVVPPWRWFELIAAEKALASIELTPEQAATVSAVLGRR